MSKTKKDFMIYLAVLLLISVSARFFLSTTLIDITFKKNYHGIFNILFILCTLYAIYKSGNGLSHYGIRFHDLPVQILDGFFIGMLWVFLGRRILLPKTPSLFHFFRCWLVALSEELVWRGYILSTLQDIGFSKLLSGLLCAIGFGMMHFISTSSVSQVILIFLFYGTIFSYLRLKKDAGIPCLVVIHFLLDYIT